MDYYVVLGIADDASEETIRSAFRALARRFHPDVGEGSSPVEFQRAREAYDTLVDPERRLRYDRRRRASRVEPVMLGTPLGAPGAPSTITSSSFFDIVEEFFASLDEDWSDHQWFRRRGRRYTE